MTKTTEDIEGKCLDFLNSHKGGTLKDFATFLRAEKKLSYLEALEDVEKMLAGRIEANKRFPMVRFVGAADIVKEYGEGYNKALSEALSQVEELRKK